MQKPLYPHRHTMKPQLNINASLSGKSWTFTLWTHMLSSPCREDVSAAAAAAAAATAAVCANTRRADTILKTC